MMEKGKLRKADFKTGITMIAFCIWFLSVTFLFMPFKETYGGVENVWYVSPWIFPTIVLTLLLGLSFALTVNAIRENGYHDVVRFPQDGAGGFQLTLSGTLMVLALALGCAAGIWYLIVNIRKEIAGALEEAKWLADPSSVQVLQWTEPVVLIPLILLTGIIAAALAILALSLHHRRASNAPDDVSSPDDAAGSGEARMRFAIIALLFADLVYILVPGIDFFICVLLFLTVFMVSFYLDQPAVIRAAMGTYLAIGAVLLVISLTGLDGLLSRIWTYSADVMVLAVTLGLMVWLWRHLSGDKAVLKKYRTCLILSWLTPLVLVPVFRFGLLVPLPREGAVIELMHQLRYSLF